mmetsp:Transcript_20939/g.35056  ORF Transcript_20939/g.35056 Transcript_20939/m.35056 type:complete len:187 (+) Transcript_20939:36-596(+)
MSERENSDGPAPIDGPAPVSTPSKAEQQPKLHEEEGSGTMEALSPLEILKRLGFSVGQVIYSSGTVENGDLGNRGTVQSLSNHADDSVVVMFDDGKEAEDIETKDGYIKRLGYRTDQVVYGKKRFKVSKGYDWKEKGCKGKVSGPAMNSRGKKQHLCVHFDRGNIDIDRDAQSDIESSVHIMKRLG